MLGYAQPSDEEESGSIEELMLTSIVRNKIQRGERQSKKIRGETDVWKDNHYHYLNYYDDYC